MRFTFIHAADLHIDSPLAGLRLKDEVVAAGLPMPAAALLRR